MTFFSPLLSRVAPDQSSGPAPGSSSLSVDVTCGPSVAEQPAVRHRVVIRHDWVVATVHDTPTERIARALGSRCGCLDFCDALVPALRAALHDVRLTNPSGARYAHAPTQAYAARSLLSAPHLAERAIEWSAGIDRKLAEVHAREILEAARRAWCEGSDPRFVVDGTAGYEELWDEGVTPPLVEDAARYVPREALPLPAEVWVCLRFAEIDPIWFESVTGCYPDPLFVEWATDPHRDHKGATAVEVASLLALGLSARTAIGVLDARIPAAAIRERALASSQSPAAIASELTASAERTRRT